MTTLPLFPSLPGQGWPVTKSPRFATRTQKAVSGRQLRIVDQILPIWSFTLTLPVLRDDNDTRAGNGVGLGIGYTELRALAGFFLALQGAFGQFLFCDPTDSAVSAQALATGDGSTNSFQLGRSFGANGFFEAPLLGVVSDGSKPFNAYLNGVLQSPSSYTLTSRLSVNGIADTINFTTAPAAGVTVSADFTYYFVCHFTSDSLDLDNFLYQLWQAKQVKFESILL